MHRISRRVVLRPVDRIALGTTTTDIVRAEIIPILETTILGTVRLIIIIIRIVTIIVTTGGEMAIVVAKVKRITSLPAPVDRIVIRTAPIVIATRLIVVKYDPARMVVIDPGLSRLAAVLGDDEALEGTSLLTFAPVQPTVALHPLQPDGS